jgi:hypothetical protein
MSEKVSFIERTAPAATRRCSGGLLSADNTGEGGWANRERMVSVLLLIDHSFERDAMIPNLICVNLDFTHLF